VKKGNESLLHHHPKIGNVYTFDKSKGKLKSMWKLIRTFRQNRYDLTINLHRFGSSGVIAGLSGAKERYGFKKNPFSFLYSKRFPHQIGDGTHEVSRNLSLITSFGAEQFIRPELFPSPKDMEVISNYQNETYICIAPASVWFTKQLPESKWVELLEKTSVQRTYILGAPGDHAMGERIIQQVSKLSVTNLCGKLSLLQSAALMQGAVENYVNDSGPLHLASAVNAPVTAFFCSTVPRFGFGPLSDHAHIKEVNNLNCRPCGLHGHKACPEGHFKCGNDMPI
jgi:heptosyltransferase-2